MVYIVNLLLKCVVVAIVYISVLLFRNEWNCLHFVCTMLRSFVFVAADVNVVVY